MFKIVILNMILMILSCKKDKKIDPVSTGDAVASVNHNRTDSKSNVEFSDKKVQEMYALYLNIKAALVNSNSGEVRIQSKKLDSIIEKSAQNTQLKATSKLISLTKDIKKQRDFFITLTGEIDKVISKAEIKSGEVYRQFCPMAFEGEGGYWLSDSKEIRNPYFGSKMLVCGEVKDVIK